ncbi:MAG: TfoX/Sxy family protein [Pseudoxanthomonas sp.]
MRPLSPMPARWRYDATAAVMGESFNSCLHDLFWELGPVSLRKMFGGQGLYHDGVIIGLVIGDELFLKTDAVTRNAFEQAGDNSFTYEGKSKPVVMNYFSPPAEAMEPARSMKLWAWLAYEAALRKKASEKPAAKLRRK